MIKPTKRSKNRNYSELIAQIKALISGESNLFANLGNVLACLKFSMNWFWVGLYKVEGDELVLFMFQGPHACTRIKKGKGVCGAAWQKNESIVVGDVNQFDGHIACNSASKSEIVLPIKNDLREVVYVLDIDSDKLNDFDDEDEKELQKIVAIVEGLI